MASVSPRTKLLDAPRDTRVRRLGALLFALVLAEGILGVASAGLSRSLLLYSHVAFGSALVGFGGWILWAVQEFPRRSARVATGYTFGALVATAVTGTAFLVTGSAAGAVVDRALATATLAGCILMIAYGTARPPLAVAP